MTRQLILDNYTQKFFANLTLKWFVAMNRGLGAPIGVIPWLGVYFVGVGRAAPAQ